MTSGWGSEALQQALANAQGPSGKPVILHYKLTKGHWDPGGGWHKRTFRKREAAASYLAALSFAHRIVIITRKKK